MDDTDHLLRRIAALEEALAELVMRYGLTPKARAALEMAPSWPRGDAVPDDEDAPPHRGPMRKH
jgi:hypothetical protein